MGTSLDHEQGANSFSPEIVGNLTSLEPAKQFHDTTRVSSPVHISNFMFHALMSRNARDGKNGRFGERAPQLTMLAKLAILAIFCQFRQIS